MTSVHIYALFDPRDPAHVRYIGKTENIERRLRQHIQAAVNRVVDRPSYEWVRELTSAGVVPGIRLLKTVPLDGWAAAERSEILMHRSAGHLLTNATEGGNGAWFPDDAARDRHRSGVSAAMRRAEVQAKVKQPKTASHKLALSVALSGRTLSSETKSKLSAMRRGKPLSAEHRARISASHLSRATVRPTVAPTASKARGAAHGMAKISEIEARAIKNSSDTCATLAAKFGLSRGYVSAIKRGLKWAHL